MASAPSATPVVITDQSTITGLNRGPITSLFAAPSSCTATISSISFWLFFGHYGDLYSSACFPSGSGSGVATSSSWDAYYYSPAICPAGWTAATTFSGYVPVASPTFFTLRPATTAAICCPYGYSYFDSGHVCRSTVTEGQNLTVMSYKYMNDRGAYSGSIITPLQTAASWVQGDGIPIMWQASDSAILARASTMTTSLPATAGTITMSPTVSAASPSTPSSTSDTLSPSPGGLSTGVKIGLGVGIPIAVIALLAVGFLLWKRSSGRQPVSELDPGHHTNYKGTSAAQGYGTPEHGIDLYGNGYQGAQQYHEMQTDPPGMNSRHELPISVH